MFPTVDLLKEIKTPTANECNIGLNMIMVLRIQVDYVKFSRARYATVLHEKLIVELGGRTPARVVGWKFNKHTNTTDRRYIQ